MSTETQPLSDGGYEMVRAAVNIARQHSCKTVATLKQRMAERFPGREDDIVEGIKFWANSVRQRYPNGQIPRD